MNFTSKINLEKEEKKERTRKKLGELNISRPYLDIKKSDMVFL